MLTFQSTTFFCSGMMHNFNKHSVKTKFEPHLIIIVVEFLILSSGLLTSYLFMKETSKRKLSVPLMIKYYLHRIWRLELDFFFQIRFDFLIVYSGGGFSLRITPTYGLVILFSYALTPYLGDGPMYPSNGFEALTCSKYWWTNLLYVNNFGNYSIESVSAK